MRSKQKVLGQFFTNESVASFMANLVISEKTKTVLDPAVGPGVFIKSCLGLKSSLKFYVYDVDEKMQILLNESGYIYSLMHRFC